MSEAAKEPGMAGLGGVRERLERITMAHENIRGDECRSIALESVYDLASEALVLLESVEGERMRRHEPWCNSHKLALCSGCSVKKGWDRNGLTGEPTKCCHGSPHEWLFKPCTCGPNDQRRCNRRRSADAILGTESENGEGK